MDATNRTRSGPATLTHPGFPDQRSEGEREPHRVIQSPFPHILDAGRSYAATGIYQDGAPEAARRRGMGQKMCLERVALTSHTRLVRSAPQ
jgi:hypothetical protein